LHEGELILRERREPKRVVMPAVGGHAPDYRRGCQRAGDALASRKSTVRVPRSIAYRSVQSSRLRRKSTVVPPPVPIASTRTHTARKYDSAVRRTSSGSESQDSGQRNRRATDPWTRERLRAGKRPELDGFHGDG